MAAGAAAAHVDGAVLLTAGEGTHAAVDTFWDMYVYGGTVVIGDTVEQIAFDRGRAIGCA